MDLAEKQQSPGLADVLAAQQRIRGRIRDTPVITDPGLNEKLGCQAWLKCENLQETGSFKLRGASNAVLRLAELGIGGDVATHSSGNHGAALALAATREGRSAWVVMPENSVPDKIDAVRQFGGNVILCQPGQSAREQGLARLVADGLTAIPPYDHVDIICGQGTAALELLAAQPGIEVLMTPVGGGGLIAGSAIAGRGTRPGMGILAAEPEGAADTRASFRSGQKVEEWRPETMADGLRAVVGHLNFALIQALVDDVLLATEKGIENAMQLVWKTTGMVIEPSSAVVIAAILEHPGPFAGKQVGLIISGGNIRRAQFPWLND